MSLPSRTDNFSMPKPISKVGTIGQSIQLEANMARLELKNEKLPVYMYVVQFSTNESEPIRRKVVEAILSSYEVHSHYAYDDSIIFLPAKVLTRNTTKFKIEHPQARKQGTKKLVQGKIIYSGKTTLVRCVKLLKYLASSLPKFLGYEPFHRVYYDPATCRKIPRSDLEVFGAFRVRLAQTEIFPTIILDVTHCIRRTQKISEIFKRIVTESKRIDGLNTNDLEDFKNSCLQKSIVNDEKNEVVHIGDVSWTLKEGDVVPLLWVWTRANRILKQLDNKNDEVCISADASDYRMLATRNGVAITPYEKSAITNFVKISPNLRATSILRFLHLAQSNAEIQKMLIPWKMSIATKLTSTPARVLPPPFIEFGGGVISKASKILWNTKTEAANQKFYNAVDFDSWVVFCTKADKNLGTKLASSMTFESRRFGLQVNRCSVVCVSVKKKQAVVEAFREKMSSEINSCIQFVIVILPEMKSTSEGKELYTNLKRLCLTDRVVVSQMINSKTLRMKSNNPRLWDVLVCSILSSVNCKLGAPLWSVQVPFPAEEKVMFVGMDVWHDNLKESHSIGALICSLDTRLNKVYSMAFRHEWHQEIFNNLYPSFLIALKAFIEVNEQLPDRIIIYRDGVLRREYDQVLEHELKQFLDAIDFMYGGVRPHISLIIVQKRVYERFFVKGNNKDAYFNPPVGTVVDHDLTRKKCFDFFLITKYKTKGTTVPTHYVLIYDNSNLDADTLQTITNAVCYSYFNWPGSFYVPSVIQYAHKLASFVGRCGVVPPVQLSKQLHFL